MTWLAFAWLVSLGTLNMNNALGDQYFVTPPDSFEATISGKLEALNDHFEIGGSVVTAEFYGGQLRFAPFLVTYGAFARLKFGPFFVGVSHYCTHPVSFTIPTSVSYPKTDTRTTVSVGLSGTTKLF